jgi:hypothetical protein
MRKTVEVAYLLALVNWMNRTGRQMREIRIGSNSLLESALHASGLYNGFTYLYQRDVPSGEQPGIIFDESPAREHKYPDDSRRSYYVHRSIAQAYNTYYDDLVKRLGGSQ